MSEAGGSTATTVSTQLVRGFAMLLDRLDGLMSPQGRHRVATAGLLLTFLAVDARKRRSRPRRASAAASSWP